MVAFIAGGLVGGEFFEGEGFDGVGFWAVGEAEEEAWNVWGKSRPTNFWFLMRQADKLVDEKKWSEAKPVLTKLVELYPGFVGPDSTCRMLAATYRNLGETNKERDVLTRFAKEDDEAPDAYQRLMELGTANADWKIVGENAKRFLAVNPLVPLSYRYLAKLSEVKRDAKTGIMAYRALAQLDPPDPAETHYQLARLLHEEGNSEARREVVIALEEAPSYRKALQLLLEVAGDDSVPSIKTQALPKTP